MKKITFTAFDSSVLPIFEVLMPNPEVIENEKTGLVIRKYRNSRGDIFQINSPQDQNVFWQLFKDDNADGLEVPPRNPADATDEELIVASNTIKSFMNRGTVIQSVDLEAENPEESVKYFLSKGFAQGFEPNCITLNKNAPLNFRLIKKGSFEMKPNPEAQVSTIDHTVINVYRNQLDKMYAMFPEEFWGGDPRDLRAHGVQFDTRVLSSRLDEIHQLIPVNNLDATEEEILHRFQDGDTYLPPYIRDAAIGNQITRGLMDTNRTTPKASKDGFLQHIAMAVNTKYGDISSHLENFRQKGMHQIPPPPDKYYELSEIDLSQRLLIPTLFKLVGVDAFSLPYTFYNGLLKPKDADVARLEEILVKDNQWEQSEALKIVRAYEQIQPALQLIGDSVISFNESKFKTDLQSVFQTQNLTVDAATLDTIIELVKFNKKKVERAQKVGSLIDFQIINVGGKNQTGYLD